MSISQNVLEIPPKSARAVRLAAGQRLGVIDLEGSQVADLVAYRADDPSEHFSQGFTRMNNDKVTVAVGDHLYSTLNAPMLRVERDPVGVHDMLYPPCNAFFYEHVFGITGKTGCREHLAAALEEFGIGYEQVTDPFNVFMHTTVDETGRTVILPPRSQAGDRFEVRAEMDLIVAVSACAADVTDCNGGRCTAIGLVVEP